MDDCINFEGIKDRDGYGRARYQGKEWRAHRLSWTLANGEIPKGMLVCHKCDNPACTNTEHLFLGSVSDNCKDKVRKGRVKGEKNSMSKLTDFDIPTIFELLHLGFTQASIAKMYKINSSVISTIKLGKSWTHIENHHSPNYPARQCQ
jgi:hypothetical protein